MNKWTYIRGTIIVVGIIATFFTPLSSQAMPSIDPYALLMIFIFCPVGLLFVLGIQVVNPMSAKYWRRPSWQLNPFNFSEPLQFFHLGTYVLFAQGIVLLLRIVTSSTPFYYEALVPLVMGAGIFIGLQLVMFIFKRKIQNDT